MTMLVYNNCMVNTLFIEMGFIMCLNNLLLSFDISLYYKIDFYRLNVNRRVRTKPNILGFLSVPFHCHLQSKKISSLLSRPSFSLIIAFMCIKGLRSDLRFRL